MARGEEKGIITLRRRKKVLLKRLSIISTICMKIVMDFVVQTQKEYINSSRKRDNDAMTSCWS